MEQKPTINIDELAEFMYRERQSLNYVLPEHRRDVNEFLRGYSTAVDGIAARMSHEWRRRNDPARFSAILVTGAPPPPIDGEVKRINIPQQLWRDVLLALYQTLWQIQLLTARDGPGAVTEQVYDFGQRVWIRAKRELSDDDD